MDIMPAYYIFAGLLLGTLFGFGIGAAGGDATQGMQLGSLAGLFVGWFIAANSLEQRRRGK